MSEYQYVAFRAIDGPVSSKNLEFMRRQSSRAEITAYTFQNEYHYGNFKGDSIEMLRRGYDIHLHYADFGIRNLEIRLPHGLPTQSAASYLGMDALVFTKDKQGHGGTLSMTVSHEPGSMDDLGDVEELFDRLVPLRAEILEGDLRPLYLGHLAVSMDDNHEPETTLEGPVPAGLDALTAAQKALTEYFCLGETLISACAKISPPLPTRTMATASGASWINSQSVATKNAWLTRLLDDPSSNVRAELLAEFRSSTPRADWPVVPGKRTLADLISLQDEIQQEIERKKKLQAAKQRSKMLADMAVNPQSYLSKTEQLVNDRSAYSYKEIARILTNLHEALAGSPHADLAEKQALKLKQKYPTRRTLVAALRNEGLIPK